MTLFLTSILYIAGHFQGSVFVTQRAQVFVDSNNFCIANQKSMLKPSFRLASQHEVCR
jgi:hypothetical protein